MVSAPDLRVRPPRSPYEMIDGVIYLARFADQARAHLAGTSGEYGVGGGQVQFFLTTLGITLDEFLTFVREADDDETLAALVRARSSSAALAELNRAMPLRKFPDEQRAQLAEKYPVLRDHPGVTTYFEMLVLDDAASFPTLP